MTTLALIKLTVAQLQAEGWMPTLVNAGIGGFVILWFALRAEGRLKANEAATNRLTRAVLLLVVSLRTANEGARGEAREVLKETDRADGENVSS